MAEYIDREKLLDELSESASYHAESGREYQLLLRDRNIVREQPTADVIERSEYEKLKQKNIELEIEYDDVMKMNALRVTEFKQLRSKIDKAIEEIDFLRQHRAKYITEDNKICIDSGEVLKILRNIGE